MLVANREINPRRRQLAVVGLNANGVAAGQATPFFIRGTSPHTRNVTSYAERHLTKVCKPDLR